MQHNVRRGSRYSPRLSQAATSEVIGRAGSCAWSSPGPDVNETPYVMKHHMGTSAFQTLSFLTVARCDEFDHT
jgi:hypothetical protein